MRSIMTLATTVGLAACVSGSGAPHQPSSLSDPTSAIAAAAARDIATRLNLPAASVAWARQTFSPRGEPLGWIVTRSARPTDAPGLCVVPSFFLPVGDGATPASRPDLYAATAGTDEACASLDPVRRPFSAPSLAAAVDTVAWVRRIAVDVESAGWRRDHVVCRPICLNEGAAAQLMDVRLIRAVLRPADNGTAELSLSLYEPAPGILDPHPLHPGDLRMTITTQGETKVRIVRDPPQPHGRPPLL